MNLASLDKERNFLLRSLGHLLRGGTEPNAANVRTVGHERRSIELGHRPIYAIGDVHGRLDLLDGVLRQIASEDVAFGPPRGGKVILLGDMIDRGPSSAGVIDKILEQRREGRDIDAVLGNHEYLMLDFLARPSAHHRWLEFGGLDTLRSYGAAVNFKMGIAELRNQLRATIPDEHLAFLRALPISIETEFYFFCHAGVRPGVPLAEQSDHDLLWLSDGMSSDLEGQPKQVVHGHQPQAEPWLGRRRLNLDTGAYATGRLAYACLAPRESPRLVVVEEAAKHVEQQGR